MKQTFNIPEGCKVVTVEQIGNQLITSFEPEKYVPKKSDFIKFGDGFAECLSDPSIDGNGLFITFGHWKPNSCDYVVFEKEKIYCNDPSLRKITPSEFQAEFEKLGYVYDFETHTAHKKRWRAEEGDSYFYVDVEYDVLNCHDNRDSFDNRLFKNGNYFKTKSDAERLAEIIKKETINFHKNNQ